MTWSLRRWSSPIPITVVVVATLVLCLGKTASRIEVALLLPPRRAIHRWSSIIPMRSLTFRARPCRWMTSSPMAIHIHIRHLVSHLVHVPSSGVWISPKALCLWADWRFIPGRRTACDVRG